MKYRSMAEQIELFLQHYYKEHNVIQPVVDTPIEVGSIWQDRSGYKVQVLYASEDTVVHRPAGFGTISEAAQYPSIFRERFSLVVEPKLEYWWLDFGRDERTFYEGDTIDHATVYLTLDEARAGIEGCHGSWVATYDREHDVLTVEHA